MRGVGGGMECLGQIAEAPDTSAGQIDTGETDLEAGSVSGCGMHAAQPD